MLERLRMLRAAFARFGLAGLIALCGCAGTSDFGQAEATDPASRLRALLSAWEVAQAGGRRCEQPRPAETPVVDCERIQKQLDRLAIEFPTHPAVLLANALVAFESGRRESAEKDLDLLRRIAPGHPEAALLRARMAIADGNLRLARRVLDEQLELTPDRGSLYELSAGVLYLERRYPEAERDLERASRLGAPSWRIAYHRGLVYEATHRPRAAAEAYRVCLELEPGFEPARSRLRGLAVRDEG